MPRRRRRAREEAKGTDGSASEPEDDDDVVMSSDAAAEDGSDAEEEGDVVDWSLPVFRAAHYKSNKATTLGRRLDECAQVLAELQQGLEDEFELDPCMVELAYALSEARLLQHANSNVRLLVARCHVELLRVFAPRQPYGTDERLLSVFDVIIAQLRGLSDVAGPQYQRCCEILQSLATVRSANALIELGHDAEAGEDTDRPAEVSEAADEQIVELFDVLLSRFSNAHGDKVERNIVDVISFCLDDMQQVSEALLHCLLRRLIPETDDGSQSPASRIATKILRTDVDRFEPLVCQFVNHILGTQSPEHKLDLGRSRTLLHELIYQLHLVDPVFELNIMPVVCQQLEVIDDEMRADAVQLLARLFQSPKARFAEQYPSIFAQFLGRFTDTESEIRMTMITFACEIITAPKPLAKVLDLLIARGSDPDPVVRMKFVQAVCDASTQPQRDGSFNLLPKSVLLAVGTRLKDKKPDIRKAAATGLGKIFATHLCEIWEMDEIEPDDPVIAKAHATVSWMPGQIFMCFAYKEPDMKLRVVQLLDAIMLRKQLSARGRALGLFQIFNDLNESERGALRHMFLFRRQAQNVVAAFLKAHQAAREDKTSKPLQAAAYKAAERMARFIPNANRRSIPERMRALCDHKDQKVFKGLETLITCSTPQATLFNVRDDVVTRLGTDTPLAQAVKPLLRHMTMHAITADMMEELLLIVEDTEDTNEAETGMDLVVQLATCFPDLFSEVFKPLGELTNSDHEPVRTKALEALSLVGQGMQKTPKAKKLAKKLKAHLLRMCAEGSPQQAKFAVRSLTRVYEPTKAQAVITELVETQVALLEDGEDATPTILKSLATLAWLCPMQVQPKALSLAKLVIGLLTREQEGRTRGRKVSPECQLRLVAMKVLANIVRGLAKVEKNLSKPTLAAAGVCIERLVEVLQNDGNPRGAEFGSTDRAAMRQGACGCLLRLARVPRFDRLITPERWQELCWTLHDESVEVRTYVLEKLSAGCSSTTPRKSLPLRYLALFMLLARDVEPDIRKQARKHLGAAVMRKHALYERKLRASKGASDLHHIMPEYSLPFAIHLLAHMPLDEGGVLDHLPLFKKHLTFLIDALLASSATNDNLGFMICILQRIRMCKDAQDPSSDAVRVLAELAQRVLTKRVRRDSNLAEFTGDVFMPSQLYTQSKKLKRVKTLLPSQPVVATSPAKRRSPKRKATKSPRRSSQSKYEDAEAKHTPVEGSRRSSRAGAKKSAGLYTEVGSDDEAFGDDEDVIATRPAKKQRAKVALPVSRKKGKAKVADAELEADAESDGEDVDMSRDSDSDADGDENTGAGNTPVVSPVKRRAVVAKSTKARSPKPRAKPSRSSRRTRARR